MACSTAAAIFCSFSIRAVSSSYCRRRCARVRLRVVEQGLDLVEREAQLPVEQDLLQPVEVGVAVAPVPRVVALARNEQADLVVVVQGAHRDSGETGDLAH